MKTLYSKFDKKLISALPRALFEGRIFVIQTEAEASRAVDYLLASAVLASASLSNMSRFTVMTVFSFAMDNAFL